MRDLSPGQAICFGARKGLLARHAHAKVGAVTPLRKLLVQRNPGRFHFVAKRLEKNAAKVFPHHGMEPRRAQRAKGSP